MRRSVGMSPGWSNHEAGGCKGVVFMSRDYLCLIDGCEKPAKARHLCEAHYAKLRRYGDPLVDRSGPRNTAADFHTRYERRGDDECWPWLRGTGEGYGQMGWRGKTTGAHRISFELANGREGRPLVRHTCDNRICVNPRHLIEGTKLDNRRDAVERKRIPVGEDHANAVLDDKKVRAMRDMRASGSASYQQIASAFGVSKHTAQMVVKRVTWRHVQ